MSSVLFVLLINTLIIYPPPQYLQGFSESTDSDEVAGIIAASLLDGGIATDHRLSTDIFSLGKENVTWDAARSFFLNPVHGECNASYILITEKMRKGAVFGWRDGTLRIDSREFYSRPLLYSDGESVVFFYSGLELSR